MRTRTRTHKPHARAHERTRPRTRPNARAHTHKLTHMLTHTHTHTQSIIITKCNRKYKFNLKTLRYQMTLCPDSNQMVNFHHLEQRFVTFTYEQVHYYKW